MARIGRPHRAGSSAGCSTRSNVENRFEAYRHRYARTRAPRATTCRTSPRADSSIAVGHARRRARAPPDPDGCTAFRCPRGPGNTMFGLAPDRKGRLWCTTANGIEVFDPADGSFFHIAVEGMEGSAALGVVIAQLGDGRIGFVAENTFFIADPDARLSSPIRCPAPYLTELRVDGQGRDGPPGPMVPSVCPRTNMRSCSSVSAPSSPAPGRCPSPCGWKDWTKCRTSPVRGRGDYASLPSAPSACSRAVWTAAVHWARKCCSRGGRGRTVLAAVVVLRAACGGRQRGSGRLVALPREAGAGACRRSLVRIARPARRGGFIRSAPSPSAASWPPNEHAGQRTGAATDGAHRPTSSEACTA